jgi:nucleotide-binding universal stress UspA family protein
MFKKIVWATDGSEAADRALPFATELATGEGRSLVAVHSKERFVGGRGGGYPVLADEDELEAKIRAQVDQLREEGIDATFQLVSGAAGHTAHLVADVAREARADVIVVGTRGHAPVAGLLLGSVTQRLLHIAPCPVLAVPAD